MTKAYTLTSNQAAAARDAIKRWLAEGDKLNIGMVDYLEQALTALSD